MAAREWRYLAAAGLLLTGACLLLQGGGRTCGAVRSYVKGVEAPVQEDGTGEEENDADGALLEAYQDYNTDVQGLICIPGSVLNHPVVQTPEDEDYYLYRDLDGKYNSHGVPFLSKDSRMEPDGGNRVIYGHNIHRNTRDVFCDLAYYEDLDYYKVHPYIETVSASGTQRWIIFAYFLVDNADADPFRYSDYTAFADEEELKGFLNEVERRNWLDVPVEVGWGDSLITLSSCSLELAGSGTNRMVVIGKLLENGEEAEEIEETAALARMAGEPLLPEKLR